MTTDILALARTTLSLPASEGPWMVMLREPMPGCAVASAGSGIWIANNGHGRRSATEDAVSIAHNRTAAPELAAFVVRLDESLTHLIACMTERAQAGDCSLGYEQGWLDAIGQLRRRLGLSTESGT